jgi:uncharacterized protein YneF (UPF0154 family)
MYLPMRYAASLTVTLVIVAAMAIGFWKAQQSNLPAALSSYQASGLVLMAGLFALPVVLPNLGAAWTANRFGSPQGIAAYLVIFTSVFLVGFWLQLRVISKLLTNSPTTFAIDRQMLIYVAVNLVICLGAALYFGRRANA